MRNGNKIQRKVLKENVNIKYGYVTDRILEIKIVISDEKSAKQLIQNSKVGNLLSPWRL